MNSADQLHATVKRYCISLTGSPLEGEDLAQDVWLRAIVSAPYTNHANPEAYLLRIAKNIWIDRSRRKTMLNRIIQQQSREEMSAVDSPSFDVEMAFQALMKHLSPLQRSVFILRDVFGYSSDETAKKLKTTEGAVKAALHRARQSLALVRSDLEHDKLKYPEDDSMKAFLRALAAAYRKGDVAEIVRLAQQDVIEPVAAIGAVQSKYVYEAIHSQRHASARSSSPVSSFHPSSMWMVA